MNILICFSQNFMIPIGVMLESLYVAHKDEDLNIYAIIDEDITTEDKKALDYLVQKHNGLKIHYYNYRFDYKLIDSIPSIGTTGIGRATYYFRLFAATILPNEVERVLYLDADTIVMGSLQGLWNKDIGECAVAGAIDQDQSYQQYNRLHYPSRKGYINTGVLLINLKYWREHCVEKRFVDFMQNYPERIKWWDQDVINSVLQDEKSFIPLKYNVQHTFYWQLQYCRIDYWGMESEIIDARKNPIVLHFTGRIKPWHIECQHPHKDVFLKFKKNTMWADVPLISVSAKLSLKQKCRSFIREMLVKLHLMSPIISVNEYIQVVEE